MPFDYSHHAACRFRTRFSNATWQRCTSRTASFSKLGLRYTGTPLAGPNRTVRARFAEPERGGTALDGDEFQIRLDVAAEDIEGSLGLIKGHVAGRYLKHDVVGEALVEDSAEAIADL